MRHVAILAAVLLIAAAARPAPAQRAQRLTSEMPVLEAKLAKEKDPAERQRLADEIEQRRHELGPRDANGVRNRCQAMWHDAAIDALETEFKRYASRAKTATGSGLGLDARGYVRRMALACLTRGWASGGMLPRYQYDAYGAYLYNNIGLLDGMFDAVAAAVAKETAPGAPGPERDAFLAACAQAKDAVAKMGDAVEKFAAEAKRAPERDAQAAAFAEFHRGLESVYEAEGLLRDTGEKPKKAGEGAADLPAPPALTADDKAGLEKVRTVAAALGQDPGWQPARGALEKFASVAEAGLQVARARAGALELLETLARTADFIQELLKSRSAYPEYIANVQDSLKTSFEYLGTKGYRQSAYSRLRRTYEGGTERKTLDASPLSDEAARGMLQAVSIDYHIFGYPQGYSNYNSFRNGLDAVLAVLPKAGQWSPKDLQPQMAALYTRAHDEFLKAAEAAGKTTPENTEALKEAYAAAGIAAKDLDRIVQADRAIKAVAQYVPARAAPMYTDFLKTAEGLISNTAISRMADRQRLDQFFPPFQELADLQLPGPEHQRIATSLTGGVYQTALATLNKQVVQGLQAAAKGDSRTLDTALDAQLMFKLLRHRCVGETTGIARVDVANMDAFSAPDKTWSRYVGALDQALRRMMAQYCTQRLVGPRQYQPLDRWDSTYCAVAAAQRLTAQTRRAGQSDLDFLMQNLAEVAAPSPSEQMQFAWAVGYHTTEAATALAAGYPDTAGWHLSDIHVLRTDMRFPKEFTAAVLDPGK